MIILLLIFFLKVNFSISCLSCPNSGTVKYVQKQRKVAEISKIDPLLSLSLGAKSSSEKQEIADSLEFWSTPERIDQTVVTIPVKYRDRFVFKAAAEMYLKTTTS